MEPDTATRREPHRESGRRRRLAILEAALAVMRRDGLRAVSHRVVAREAGVPPAATTYYFAGLEELITESFLHWSATQRQPVEQLSARVQAQLAVHAAAGTDPLAEVADTVSHYVAEQVGPLRADRELEFAFLHESLRMPRLRAAVDARQRSLAGFLAEFHRALGSPCPETDAEISHGVLTGLEREALLAGDEAPGREALRAVLLRYLRLVVPGQAGGPAENSRSSGAV